jgi:hypothetical protein
MRSEWALVAASIPSRRAWEEAVARGIQVRVEHAVEAAALERRAALAARLAVALAAQPEISTPLHPRVLGVGIGARPCRHQLYVIASGYRDGQGRPYVRHYCWCGTAYEAFYE